MLIKGNHVIIQSNCSLYSCIVENEAFIGLYSDLVQIPEIRKPMLNVLRWPEKSPQLSQAIGRLFGQATL